jgi:hypothetical protein
MKLPISRDEIERVELLAIAMFNHAVVVQGVPKLEWASVGTEWRTQYRRAAAEVFDEASKFWFQESKNG